MKTVKGITITITIPIMIMLASCVATQSSQDKLKTAMDSWLGSHKSELIAQLGPPDRVTTDGLDGEIYIYETHFSTSGYSSGYAINGIIYTYGSAPRGYTRSKSFYVDGSGKIYHWKVQTK